MSYDCASGVLVHCALVTLLCHMTLQVVPADYAYVLHTANPVTGAEDQMFGEVAVGMGEVLVGNHPGR